MKTKLVLLAAVVMSVLAVEAARKPKTGWWLPPLTAPTLDPQYWSIRFSIGMPMRPTVNPSGGWFFDFPVHATSSFSDCNTTTCATPPPEIVATSCCESIHYLTQPHAAPLPIGQSISATINISTTGNPVFLADTQPGECHTPASVRFFVQVLENRRPPPYIMLDENARWWSNPVSFTLSDTGGPIILSAPIDPSQWSNVAGHKGDSDSDTLAGFLTAMQTHDGIGFTFGGCGTFGHGVGLASGGTARFTLTNLVIE